MFDMGFLPDVRRVLKHVPGQAPDAALLGHHARRHPPAGRRHPARPGDGAGRQPGAGQHGRRTRSTRCRSTRRRRCCSAMLEKTATGRVLVFTRTKHRARKLALHLGKYGYRVQPRCRATWRRTGARRPSTASATASTTSSSPPTSPRAASTCRTISHVINYDMPDTADAYTHRIGRTGRAHQTGEAFTFSQPADEPLIRAVEKVLGAPIERRRLSGFVYTSMAAEPAPAPRGSGGSRPGRMQGGGGQTSRPGQPQRGTPSTGTAGRGSQGFGPGGGSPNQVARATDPGGRNAPDGGRTPDPGGRRADPSSRNDSGRPPQRRRRRPQSGPGGASRAYASGGA